MTIYKTYHSEDNLIDMIQHKFPQYESVCIKQHKTGLLGSEAPDYMLIWQTNIPYDSLVKYFNEWAFYRPTLSKTVI